MKKIILMGKRCDETHDLYVKMNEYFEVKLCTTDYNLFQGTRKIFKPDLIVICFANYFKPDNRVMDLLADKNRSVPIITVALESVDPYYEKIMGESAFRNIKKKDGVRQILPQICEMLGVSLQSSERDVKLQHRDKPLILVVDDFALLLRQIRIMLKDRYDVEVATSGVQAMAAIGRTRPDLILLDYAMPVYDGEKIFEVLKIKEETKDIPVVFLTGVADPARVEEIINLKPAGYLLKPPNKERLIEMIDHALEKSRRAKQKEAAKEN